MLKSESSRELAGMPDGSVFIPVPLCYQENEYACGVACIQSLLARYGIRYRQSALADLLNSRPILGTDPESIRFFAQLLGFQASLSDHMKIDELKNAIDSGITPLLILQAWSDDEIEYSFDWKDSHYIIACGYYNKGFYAMDPCVLGNYAHLPYLDLMNRWHHADPSGIHHIRSGLILEYENCPVKYDPSVIKYLG